MYQPVISRTRDVRQQQQDDKKEEHGDYNDPRKPRVDESPVAENDHRDNPKAKESEYSYRDQFIVFSEVLSRGHTSRF